MSTLYDKVIEIIADMTDLEARDLHPEANLVALGMDSVDILDAVFQFEARLGVTIPVDRWSDEIAEGAPIEDYFVVRKLVERIEALLLAQG